MSLTSSVRQRPQQTTHNKRTPRPSHTFVAILAIHLGTYSQVPRGNMESHALIDVIVKRLDFLGETVDGRNPKQPPPGI